MRARSTKNSRPHEDVELRRAYKAQNDKCELAPILVGARIESFDKIWKAWNEPKPADTPLDPNHIFSMGSRPDVWSNLISVCRPVHDWFHKHLVEGRIACLYVKAVLKDEVDLAELDAVFGQSVLAWLSRQTVCAYFDRLRLETIRAMKSEG